MNVIDIDGDGDDDADDGDDAEHGNQDARRSDVAECSTNPGHDYSETQVLKESRSASAAGHNGK